MFKVRIIEILEKEVENAVYEKVADSGNKYDGKAQYGYIMNPIPKVVKEERDIFEQVCGDLDIVAVIKAVNRL